MSLQHTIQNATQILVDHVDELTELDQAIGDGDHGLNMKRGAQAIQAKLPEMQDTSLNDALKTMGAIVRDFRRIGRFVKVCAHWVVNYMQVQDTTKTIFRLGLFPILVHDKPSSMVQTFYKSLGYSFHSQIQIYWWLRFNQPRVPTSHIPQKSFFYFS